MIVPLGAALLSVLFAGAASALDARRCLYDVHGSADLTLDVTVTCDPDVRALNALDRHSHGHLSVLSTSSGEDRFTARYRVALAAMARESASVDAALQSGNSILAVASSWLLYPVRESRGPAALEIRVAMAPGIDFATAQPMVDGSFTIPQSELDMAGFSAFGRFRRYPMTEENSSDATVPATFEVVVLDGPLGVDEQLLIDWIRHCAGIMTRFWHGFPSPGMKIFVLPRAGADGVSFGRDMSGGGVSMLLVIGENTTREKLDDDWVLIHELVHVGSPFVKGAPWLTEGLATYFEPLIRARYGLQSPDAMWTEFITNMPRGAAVIGSTGLMRGGFRGWYWGGGLLMLLADVNLRRASSGRLGLEDCLRAIRTRFGDYARTIGLEDMISACDAAVGGTTLTRLVERHARSANAVDLDALWRDLGVRLVDGVLVVDDHAPLAAVRNAIVRGGVVAAVQ
jgi:hypothetical protein